MTDVVASVSRYSYAETVDRLTRAIQDGGATLFANIDQAKAAKDVGLSLRPTTLLVFGNPKGGTPLMQAFPLAALDLPLRIVVWEENGIVNLARVPMKEVGERYGVVGMDVLLAVMDRTFEAVIATVA